METNLEPILTVPEVSRYLKLSKSKVYYLIQKGQIPYLRIGRNVRIRESDLKKWVDANCFSLTMFDGTQVKIHPFR